MAAAAPVEGSDPVEDFAWIPALLVTVMFEAGLITAALRTRGNLGSAAGAALHLRVRADGRADEGRDGEPGRTAGRSRCCSASWQLYAAAAGVGALFLFQNALQAGSLVAVQPMLTLGDALISILFERSDPVRRGAADRVVAAARAGRAGPHRHGVRAPGPYATGQGHARAAARASSHAVAAACSGGARASALDLTAYVPFAVAAVSPVHVGARVAAAGGVVVLSGETMGSRPGASVRA
ncbi:hypothetical protein SBADM41S_05769 [Streptomyces badius]